MSRLELPARPNLEHLKNQAKQLHRAFFNAEPAATERFLKAAVVPAAAAPKFADALHVIALEYGFETWPNLKAHVGALSEVPEEALIAAIRANDAQLVRAVLERHPELKLRIDEPLPNFGFDAPALIGAVGRDNREMVDALLDAGANINARTKWWAGGFGVLDSSSTELTFYLIERGAYVDIHAAARLGMFGRVKELVAADPGLVHARGGDGQTALHFASSVEIAAYLLDHGADIDARDIDHESTAAQYMAAHWPRRAEVARYLISRGAQADILMAAALGDLELVRGFLDDDPAMVRMAVFEKSFPKQDPRAGGSIYIFGFGWGKTPHVLARELGFEDVFQLLMQRSPLWLRFVQACEVGDEALAQEVLAKHPHALATMTRKAAGRIIGPVIRNDTRAVRMILAAGWPANVRRENGQTPLHWAAWHGNVEMVRELIAHNAPLDAREAEHDKTPVDWALHGSEQSWFRDKGDYAETVRVLLEAGAAPAELRDDLEGSEDALVALRRYGAQKNETA